MTIERLSVEIIMPKRKNIYPQEGNNLCLTIQ